MVRAFSHYGGCLVFLAVCGVVAGKPVRAQEKVPAVALRVGSETNSDPTWHDWLSASGLPDESLAGSRPWVLAKARALLDSLQPASPEELDGQRGRAHESAKALDQFLATWRGSGQGWRDYLRLAELIALTAAPPTLASEEGVAAASQVPATAPATEEGSRGRLQALLKKFDNPTLDAKYRGAFRKPAFQAAQEDLRAYVALWQRREADHSDQVQTRVRALLVALDAFERSGAQEQAVTIRRMADAMAASPIAEERNLAGELRRQYLSPNVRLVVTREMLQKFTAGPRQDRGPVHDWLGGAEIVGNQTTKTTPDIELHPSDKAASFSLVLKGTSDSRTTAYKDPARIYGSSHSEFTARKRLEITANGLRALAAEVKVHETNNEILGADTDVGGLFAGMARNTAMKKARERIPDAEALAARRVRERVASRLNQEVDASVTSINRRLRQGPGAALEQHGLGPASLAAHSTSKELVVEASLLFANQLAAGSPPAALPKGARAVVQIHESAVNNAIDQLGLAGQTIEGAHVRERIAQALAPVFGTSVKLPDDPEQQAPEGSITFAARAPLRVRFVDGQIEVILHAASLQRGNLKTPAQVIRARYQPVLAENRVTLRRQGDVEIRAAEISPEVVSISLQGFAAARDAAIGAALRAPMDRVFRPQINSPKAFTITTELGNVVPLEVTALESRDGWLTLAVR